MGVTLALPWLETFAHAAAPTRVNRFFRVANPFGMIQGAFFPTGEGPAHALPSNLAPFDPLRGNFTGFSNIDHGNTGGHGGTHMLLSGVKSEERCSALRNSSSARSGQGPWTAPKRPRDYATFCGLRYPTEH